MAKGKVGSLGILTSAAIAHRSGLRFAAGTYRIRIFGATAGLLSATPIAMSDRAITLPLIGFAMALLLWPHLAYMVARRSMDPVSAERRNLLIDSIFAGAVVALLNFRLVPSMIVLLSVAMNSIAVGGIRRMFWGCIASALGAIVGIGLFGGHVTGVTEPYSTLAMLPMMVFYPLFIGKFAHDASTRLADKTRQLKALSELDALTGLLNRTTFIASLDRLLRACTGKTTVVGIIFIDLDNFKVINDSLGHKTGDRVLTRLSGRLMRISEQGGLICRYGGDEFVAAVQVASAKDLSFIATKIISDMSRDVSIDGTRLKLGASVGISVFPENAVDATSLITRADAAMYRAKHSRKGTAMFYDEQMAQASAIKYRIARSLRAAIQKDLKVHYQPQVDMSNGKLVAVEALVRWYDTDLGHVSPELFMPIAEELGLIGELGMAVMRLACTDVARWRAVHNTRVQISINVSVPQLRRPEFLEDVRGLITSFQIEPSQLVFEVTESALLNNDGDARSTFERLAELGVGVAVDAFGTGYSNLSYLHTLKVDRIKIDHSLIKGLPATEIGQSIVTAMIAMAHAMQLTIVAEGVETWDQARWLVSHGCLIGQGQRFCAPLPTEEFERWLMYVPVSLALSTTGHSSGLLLAPNHAGVL
ncbi:putative bifunctional diguanylate cyclase/phosphodiesterase [Caballeronia sp. 15715]|uniref:putative bifunctional diguanylate cyclase/phosphodiesterase n=1 Tax=unclassified Caballeronia TaxID=2646786 RepID=UPI0039E231D0